MNNDLKEIAIKYRDEQWKHEAMTGCAPRIEDAFLAGVAHVAKCESHKLAESERKLEVAREVLIECRDTGFCPGKSRAAINKALHQINGEMG